MASSSSTEGLSDVLQYDMNIILVDDEPIARKVLTRSLQKCGYKNVTCVGTAKQALELIRENNYNVALCDVLMPEMDGHQLLQAIRAMPHTSELSVIMISATEDLSTVYKCLQDGADDYLVKPVKLNQLRNLWSNIWKKKKERAIREQLQREKTKSDTLGQELQNLQGQLSDLNSKIGQAVDTPITAITRTILDLQNQANLTDEVRGVLGQVLHTLAGSDLYKPAFNKMLENQSVDKLTKTWLISELGGNAAAVQEEEEDNDDIGQLYWAPKGKEECSELQTFEYDVWSKSEDDLVVLLNQMFDEFGLLEMFKVDLATFKKFLLKVRSQYISKNPYHNFYHGFDVTQTVYSFLTTGQGAKFLNSIEIFGLLIASLCHDVGHFGLNNLYLMTTGHELAIRYNDQSVLENYHCSLTFTILNDPEYNIFKNLDRSTYTSLRKLIVGCILATDLSKHMEFHNKFQSILDNFQKDNADHRTLLMQLLIKTADISNPAKPFPIARYWADMVQEEFFIQGDRERKEELPISTFMDRENPNLCQLQTGFADYFVIPIYTVLSKFLPETKPCLETLLTNRKTWDNIANSADTQ